MLAARKVEDEAVRPPFRTERFGNHCGGIPAGDIIVFDGPVVCHHHVADAPDLTPIDAVHVLHPLLQMLPRTAVKTELGVISPIGQMQVLHLLRIMYGGIELHRITVGLCILLPGLVLLLYTELHSLQQHIVLHVQHHVGRVGKEDRHRVFLHQFLVPGGGGRCGNRQFQLSGPVIDFEFHSNSF